MVLLFHSVLFFSSKLLFWSQQLGSLPSTEKYYKTIKSEKPPSPVLSLGTQFLDEGYSLSKSLSSKQIVQLALRGCQRNAVDVILTASDVAIEGIFSEPLCPGQCAWPFCQPIYGPQSPRLVAPNSDVLKKHHWTLHQAVLGFMAKDPIQVVLLVESATGASYKAHGVNGRKYLLPAMFDPSTSTGA
ncbi:hypothetical protein D5086_022468 [Populus alba]|uniref:Uncharacterized protein n=1 Tax=Populus alba TaxID=43335 RepID=A0ACC4BF77_POPAL